MNSVLSTRGLRKQFGSRTVLDGVDLDVPEGSVYALLGDNGAGKTTLLSCVEGIMPPDGGSVRIQGRLGVQLQSGSLPEHIRGDEALRLFSAWTGRGSADLDALGLRDFARRKYGEMSVGQRRRLHLALALLSDPDIVILDEPTAGLDVRGRADLHAVIRTLRDAGKTIVLTTHDMAEAESLCDRLAILRNARIVFEGAPGELGARFGRQFRIRVRTNMGNRTALTEDLPKAFADILRACAADGETIESVSADRGSLEEHFLKFDQEAGA